MSPRGVQPATANNNGQRLLAFRRSRQRTNSVRSGIQVADNVVMLAALLLYPGMVVYEGISLLRSTSIAEPSDDAPGAAQHLGAREAVLFWQPCDMQS